MWSSPPSPFQSPNDLPGFIGQQSPKTDKATTGPLCRLVAVCGGASWLSRWSRLLLVHGDPL
jgi:hypothetical protein